MKKLYLLIIAVALFIGYSNVAFSQFVGTNIYLQGRYVEIGMNNNGSFGACNNATYGVIPAGYHPHLPGTSALAEVYDYGHDGWTTGTPPYMGDYTYPGSPFEGWAIQVNGVRGQCYQTCPGNVTFNAGWLTGSNSGYSNTGGRAIGIWTGTAASGALQIRKQTRVDTLASWVTVTVTMKNTTAAPIPGVYYWRSCDPDNDQSWPGGGFPTTNTVIYQNDIYHRVLVSSRGALGAIAYLGLGTKDCRARCLVYSSWGLSSGVDLATVWNGTYATGTSLYTPGATNTADVGIGLVYNIGTIPANDSAIVSYAYIFSNNNGLDSAFPEPQLVVNGNVLPTVMSPATKRDTFNACLYPGLTTIPVSILYADDKAWSWSKWTWTPAIGLSSTTGTSSSINVMGIPNYTTYTITGTDSATGMMSCNTKTFYLTIITCGIYATADTPCEGSTLTLKAHGDSTGATYTWFGPAPSTTVLGTTQYLTIPSVTSAMAGMYTVIRHQGADDDTAFVNVFISPTPTISGTLNVCVGGTTALSASPPGGLWSGGSGATATIDPATGIVTGINTGTTTVTYISPAGCMNTAIINVYVPSPITGLKVICQGYTTTLANPVAGGVWSSGNPSVAIANASTGVITGISGGVAPITYNLGGGCIVTDSVRVNPTPEPITGSGNVCQFFTTTLADVTPGGTWTSSNTAVATIGASGIVSGLTAGTTTITYTITATGCYITRVFTVNPKPAPPVYTAPVYCQFAIPVPLAATGTNLEWYGPGSTGAFTLAPTPSTDSPGVRNYYVTQTSSFGCRSDSATVPVTIIPHPEPPLVRDTMYCQGAMPPALTAVGSNLKWYNASGTLLSAAPVPATTFVGTTTWYVSQTVSGCESDKVPISVTIIYKPEFTISSSRVKTCQHDTISFWYTGPSLVGAGYQWNLPTGAVPINGTSIYDSFIVVRFDTARQHNIVYLTASNLNGMCFTTMSLDVKVIPQPAGNAWLKADICKGDTISLALVSRTSNASEFDWWVNDQPLFSTPAVNIITASSSSGGPFLITFNDTGRHIIKITSYADAENRCPSKPTFDTVNVHALPDASFEVKAFKNSDKKICIEDSVYFEAKKIRYNWTYTWAPEHSFHNENKPGIWGRVESERSIITLTVTDPFGCRATSEYEINPEACCSVFMPTAFSPNGDGKNDTYQPKFQGFHRFHIFRITNRWGQTIFESTNSNAKWDGTYNGVPQDMGVYFYYIKYDCGGKVMETKGDCTLVR